MSEINCGICLYKMNNHKPDLYSFLLSKLTILTPVEVALLRHFVYLQVLINTSRMIFIYSYVLQVQAYGVQSLSGYCPQI